MNDITNYSDVKTVTSVSNVTNIAVGNAYTCVTLTSNQVSCWGENDDDRLGLPWLTTNTNQLIPQATVGLTGVASIYTGLAHTCALMQDNSVKCWGFNNRSQTGVSRQYEVALLPWQEISRGTFGD